MVQRITILGTFGQSGAKGKEVQLPEGFEFLFMLLSALFNQVQNQDESPLSKDAFSEGVPLLDQRKLAEAEELFRSTESLKEVFSFLKDIEESPLETLDSDSELKRLKEAVAALEATLEGVPLKERAFVFEGVEVENASVREYETSVSKPLYAANAPQLERTNVEDLPNETPTRKDRVSELFNDSGDANEIGESFKKEVQGFSETAIKEEKAFDREGAPLVFKEAKSSLKPEPDTKFDEKKSRSPSEVNASKSAEAETERTFFEVRPAERKEYEKTSEVSEIDTFEVKEKGLNEEKTTVSETKETAFKHTSKREVKDFSVEDKAKDTFRLEVSTKEPKETNNYNSNEGPELNPPDFRPIDDGRVTTTKGAEGTPRTQEAVSREGISPREVPEFVTEIAVELSPSGERKARIKMEPPELGEVEVDVEVRRGEVKLVFSVERSEVARELHLHLPHLRELFEQNGLKLTEFQVAVGSFGGGEGTFGERNDTPERRSHRPLRSEVEGVQTETKTKREKEGLISFIV